MQSKKVIVLFCLGAFAASIIPYRIRNDKEAGTLEVRSLLWGVKKTPGEGKDHYSIAIPSSELDA